MTHSFWVPPHLLEVPVKWYHSNCGIARCVDPCKDINNSESRKNGEEFGSENGELSLVFYKQRYC